MDKAVTLFQIYHSTYFCKSLGEVLSLGSLFPKHILGIKHYFSYCLFLFSFFETEGKFCFSLNEI